MRARKITTHSEFVRYCRNTGRFSVGTTSRAMRHKIDTEKIVIPELKTDSLLEKAVSLHPEAAAFLFHMEGCPRKLLMYLMFFEVDLDTCLFRFNASVIKSFADYCMMFGPAYADKVVKKAIGQLTRRNAILSTARGTYMVNPLLYGGKVPATRRELINKYGSLLIKKRKEVVKYCYPIYTRSRPKKSTTDKAK